MTKITLILSLCFISTELFAQVDSNAVFLSDSIPANKISKRPTVAVVLGGGGARGISHIGAFKMLEKHNIPIDLIIGVSMGSIMGGLYASGYSASQLEEFVLTSDWDDLLAEELERKTLLASQQEAGEQYNFSFRFQGFKPYIPLGLSSGQKLTRRLNRLFLQAPFKPDPDFDHLKIPFRTVVLDLKSGNPVVFSEGDMVEILRASIAVPLLLSPIEKDGMLLTDGGIVNALPTDIAREMGADIVIAFDVVAPLRDRDDLGLPWQIADQIITIMMQPSLKELRKYADIIVRPDLANTLPADFSNPAELIKAGAIATEAKIAQIDSMLKNWKNDNGHPALFQRSAPVSIISNDIFISSVILNGNSRFSDEEIVSASGLNVPGNLSSALLDKALELIIRLYRNDGYSLAEFSEINYDSSARSLEIQIEEGLISDIAVEGNDYTSDQVILSEFPLSVGDLFNIRKADKGLDNIYATRFFRQVSLYVEKTDAGHKIFLRVEEQPYLRVLVGVRTDKERATRGKIELRHENLFGSGNNASISGILGERDKEVLFRYRAPKFMNTFLTNGIQIGYSSKDDYLYGDGADRIGEYNEKRIVGSFLIGAQVRRFGAATGELMIIDTKIRGLRDRGFFREEDTGIVAVRLRSTVDRRNKLPVPTRGQFSRFTYTFALSTIGSNVSYNSFEGMLEFYHTFNKRLTFRPLLSFGIADLTTPFSEQFRLGGRKTFYGTRENRFVGRKFIYSSYELRYRLPVKNYFNIHFSLRYDFGKSLTNPETAFSFGNFVSGYGGAVIFETPIAPASIEWGKSSEGTERVYITAGYDFN